MIDLLQRLIEQAQGTIFEGAIQPGLYRLGLIDWSEDVFDGVGFVLFGALAVALAYGLFRPLELWRPVERWAERRAVRTDVVYTLVHRLGVVPVIIFLLLTPIGVAIDGYLRFEGYIPPTLEQLIAPLRAWPFVTFLAYIVLIDFGEYWRHRLQHRLGWWWALHSLHHDQRQLTLWADDRNHLIDDVLAAVWSGTLALLVGVAPAEYPLVMIAFRLIESLAHTNVRIGFRPDRLPSRGRAAISPAAPCVGACRGALRPHDGVQFRGDPAGVGCDLRHQATRQRVSTDRRREPCRRRGSLRLSAPSARGVAPPWRGVGAARRSPPARLCRRLLTRVRAPMQAHRRGCPQLRSTGGVKM